MLVLDTDHSSELEVRSLPGQHLLKRLSVSGDDAVITAVTVEENLRGWLAEIRSRPRPRDQMRAYARLVRTVESHAKWTILPWDDAAVTIFEGLVARRIRAGTQDLKIAAIAIAHAATLLTRNTKDRACVPGLKFANWLD